MEKINSALLALLRQSAHKHGSGCDPLWLHNAQVPDLKLVEPKAETGPEIILLHGLLGALSNWDDLIPKLVPFAKPIALHFPILTGHRSEVKVKALALLTEYLIRTRNIQPVTLCGNSMGGHVALRLCLAAPELVDCLILSGSSGLYEHSVDSLPVRPQPGFIKEHMGRVFYNERFITDEAVNEIVKTLSGKLKTLNLIHAARSAKKDNLADVLPLIKVPTLLIWGENDQVTTMQVAEQFHKYIPNSELITIPKCGHAPMIEYPEWFAEQVKKFVSKHSRYYKQA